jgi:DNA-nicking Smr family endonuclease
MESRHRTRLTQADRAIWASYASRVRPLNRPAHPAILSGPEPADSPAPRPRQPSVKRAIRSTLPPLATGTQPGGVDSATWHRFRTGKLPVARTLDLHGHTVQRAFEALVAFLRDAHAEGVRCVEVVTGQSGALRRELPLWLNLPELRPLVLATAHPHAANPGAVRLLLRRVR